MGGAGAGGKEKLMIWYFKLPQIWAISSLCLINMKTGFIPMLTPLPYPLSTIKPFVIAEIKAVSSLI